MKRHLRLAFLLQPQCEPFQLGPADLTWIWPMSRDETMRVLFITRKWPPAVGGMETYSVELAEELGRENDVTLHALPGRSNGDTPGGLAIAHFGVATAWRLLTDRGRYDVIHGGDLAIWPLVAIALLRQPSARAVLAAHGTDVAFAFRSGALSWFYKVYLRLGGRLVGSGGVIANSEATARLAQTLGFRKVHVVPLATRLKVSSPVQTPGRFVLFAGRLVRRKGLAWFVENVLPLLPRDLELQVAGTVWDERERAALSEPRVKFLGALPQEDLFMKMRKALCVVAPNVPVGDGHFEGFGLIAVEAAASGAVMLASDMDGYRSSVIHGVTGTLLPPGNAGAWADAISRISEWSEDERARVIEGAQQAAVDKFSWSRVASDTIAVYKQV